jgi:hypothetical protein
MSRNSPFNVKILEIGNSGQSQTLSLVLVKNFKDLVHIHKYVLGIILLSPAHIVWTSAVEGGGGGGRVPSECELRTTNQPVYVVHTLRHIGQKVNVCGSRHSTLARQFINQRNQHIALCLHMFFKETVMPRFLTNSPYLRMTMIIVDFFKLGHASLLSILSQYDECDQLSLKYKLIMKL